MYGIQHSHINACQFFSANRLSYRIVSYRK